MKFSAVIVFALGAAAAAVPDNSPVEDIELISREQPVEISELIARQTCNFNCPNAVRIGPVGCLRSCQSNCVHYACRGGNRAVCSNGVRNCVGST
ncbi:hypothetical protein RB594_004069 [Gaeumannomyces avenae]